MLLRSELLKHVSCPRILQVQCLWKVLCSGEQKSSNCRVRMAWLWDVLAAGLWEHLRAVWGQVSAFRPSASFFPESGNKMLAFTGRIPGCANGACAVRAAVSQPLLSYALVSYPKCVLWDLGLGLCLFSCASVSTTSSFPLGEGTFLTARMFSLFKLVPRSQRCRFA